ncbi:hypothetical protein ACFX15_021544 [Malus domestica]
MENGVTRVSTLYSNLNVKYMESKVLMGKLMGKQLDARTIKWKLGLTWGSKVKNPFYLDHFGHRWYAIEFTNEKEIEFALDNRPWYVRGQIFHMERWNVHFKDTNFISNLRVWIRIPRVPVKYRDAKILEVITQPVGNFISVDETTLLVLHGLFVRVLLEVDLRLPLKRILVPTLVDEVGSVKGETTMRGEMVQEQMEDEDGWNTVPVRKSKSDSKGKNSGRRDSRIYENVVRGNRTWVSKADLSTDSKLKGKGVNEFTDLETDKVFMETEDGEFEQMQARGNKKRVRSEGKSGEGSNYNLEDVD